MLYSVTEMEIQDIIKLQQANQLTDGQFAEKVSVCRETWNRIKNGKLPLNDKFLMRIYRAFPECNIFLFDNVTSHDKVVTIPSDKLTLIQRLLKRLRRQ